MEEQPFVESQNRPKSQQMPVFFASPRRERASDCFRVKKIDYS
jgi:hypothetical protein